MNNDYMTINKKLLDAGIVKPKAETVYVVSEDDRKSADALNKLDGCIAMTALDAAADMTCMDGCILAFIPGKEYAQAEFVRSVADKLHRHGKAAGIKIIEDLQASIYGMPDNSTVADLLDSSVKQHGEGRGQAEVIQTLDMLVSNAPPYVPEVVIREASDINERLKESNKKEADAAKLVFYEDVEYEEPKYIIDPLIPVAVVIGQGDSGVGKTAVACKFAADVSRGEFMGQPCQQGKVLILSVEDDPSTLRGRIEASGGDLSQIAFLNNAHSLTFLSPIIEETIKENNIKLVIFDPLQAYLSGKVDMHRANETRPVMAHLAAMAKRTGCAVLIISHMSKGTAGGKAIYRTLGSVDIPAASRSVLYIERNPDDTDQCVMVHTKSSNAKPSQSILYRIGERGGVTWEGYSSLKYEDLQRQAERAEKGIDYEDDPIVMVMTMLHKENPGGVFLSWEQLDNYANKILGYFPCSNGKEWNAKLKCMQREFAERSRIMFDFRNTYLMEHVECGETITPDEKRKVRGVEVKRFVPNTEFQRKWRDE